MAEKNEKINWRYFTIDKVVMVIILAVFSSCMSERLERVKSELNVGLEKVKNDLSYNNDINKVRINKIGEVWEKVDTFNGIIGEQLFRMRKLIDRSWAKPRDPNFDFAKEMDQLTEQQKGNMALKMEVATTLERNRFWIGEDTYQQINNYLNISQDYMEARYLGNSTSEREQKAKELEIKMNQARQNLDEIKRKFLEEK